MTNVRALTICQPYAHLIAIGQKVVENRTWPTSYRGTLLIHAGKSKDWLEPGDEVRYPSLVYGAFVAVAELVGCVPLDKLPESYRGHKHANGPVCWLLRNVRPLSNPVRAKGGQGLWTPERGDYHAVLVQVSGVHP